MTKVSGGDVTQLGLLFERHHKMLYGYFTRLLPGESCGEDLVQEVFFRVLKYKHTYKSSTPFRFWLLRIARNAAMDHCRKSKPEEPVMDMPTEAPDPMARLAFGQDVATLRKAFGGLSMEKREVLVLSRFEDMKYADIADLTGVSVATIKVRVHRALNDLRRLFRQVSKEKAS
jgi:RNA polymerase sigma-70 factor (ECF subfamily)